MFDGEHTRNTKVLQKRRLNDLNSNISFLNCIYDRNLLSTCDDCCNFVRFSQWSFAGNFHSKLQRLAVIFCHMPALKISAIISLRLWFLTFLLCPGCFRTGFCVTMTMLHHLIYSSQACSLILSCAPIRVCVYFCRLSSRTDNL